MVGFQVEESHDRPRLDPICTTSDLRRDATPVRLVRKRRPTELALQAVWRLVLRGLWFGVEGIL